MKQVKLYVNGIFNMSFGKTFFTGILENHDSFINNSFWELMINGEKINVIEIESEQIVKKTNQNNYRSLATKKIIDIDVDLDKDNVELVLIN